MDKNQLKDKVIIVTGGNSGIGYEATKVFCKEGAHVVMASRNKEKATKAIQTLKSEISGASLTYLPLNLADLSSVREFVKMFNDSFDHLDVLVNNAGVLSVPYQKTKDGFEYQMGINHLGHFALSGLLIPALKKAKKARIVTVSSLLHKNGHIDFANFQFEKSRSYKPDTAYARSKLANLLFGLELDRKLKAAKLDIQSLVVHPGISRTNLFTEMKKDFIQRQIMKVIQVFSSEPKEGALPMIEAVMNLSYQGGDYIGPSGLGSVKGKPKKSKYAEHASSLSTAKMLWNLSETLTKVTYKF